MESKIVDLDRAIKKDPRWSVITSSLNLTQLQYAFIEASHLTHGFIFTQDYENQSMLGSMWTRLMTLQNEIFKMLPHFVYRLFLLQFLQENEVNFRKKNLNQYSEKENLVKLGSISIKKPKLTTITTKDL